MGGRAGGGGAGLGSRSGGGDASMRHLSSSAQKALKEREDLIRNSGNEKIALFDENGNLLYENNKGGRSGISIKAPDSVIENSIITHNHPAIDKKGALRSDGGGSFSEGDITLAISKNAKEIRAVTGRYTYSIRRPKGGWSVDYEIKGKKFYKLGRYAYYENKFKAAREKYIANYKGDKELARRRSFSTLYHRITKAWAKEMGVTYTVTKIK